jgi:hypothetical protein
VFINLSHIVEGEIHSQAIRETLSARDRYLKFKDNNDYDTNDAKAGLTFHIDNTAAMLHQIGIKAEFVYTMYDLAHSFAFFRHCRLNR